jgi:hypothetical protein
MNKFIFVAFKGVVEFNTPDASLWIIEDVGEKPEDTEPKQIYYCREVCLFGCLVGWLVGWLDFFFLLLSRGLFIWLFGYLAVWLVG